MHSSCEGRCGDCPKQLVCHCLGITESDLLAVLDTHEINSVADLRRASGAGDGCTACHRRLAEYVQRYSIPICSVR